MTSPALQKDDFCTASQMTKRLANAKNAVLTGFFVPLHPRPQYAFGVDMVHEIFILGVDGAGHPQFFCGRGADFGGGDLHW